MSPQCCFQGCHHSQQACTPHQRRSVAPRRRKKFHPQPRQKAHVAKWRISHNDGNLFSVAIIEPFSFGHAIELALSRCFQIRNPIVVLSFKQLLVEFCTLLLPVFFKFELNFPLDNLLSNPRCLSPKVLGTPWTGLRVAGCESLSRSNARVGPWIVTASQPRLHTSPTSSRYQSFDAEKAIQSKNLEQGDGGPQSPQSPDSSSSLDQKSFTPCATAIFYPTYHIRRWSPLPGV